MLHDWTFDQMTQVGQGWHLQGKGSSLFPPLSTLDATVYEVLRQTASSRGRIAIGVPRVVTGLALGPLIFTTLTLFVQQWAKDRIAKLANFHSFPFSYNHPLIVASRLHALREMWANSALTFNRKVFPFAIFPTYRVARNGEFKQDVYSLLVAGNRSTQAQRIKGLPDIVLYDFWPLASGQFANHATGILAELAATDSSITMQRLLALIDASQPSWVLVILNLHDIEKRRRLIEEGFAFIATPYLASDEVLQNIALCPSFTAVEASVPREVKATWKPLPQEDPVSICLADAFQEIANTNWEAQSRDSLPGLLNRAWYLLNQLSTCPVPLPFYEKMRRNDPREKSLGFWLNKLDQVNWQQVPDPVRGLLLVHWHSIVEQLRAAYAALEQNNPLWWYLADLALNADMPMMLLMPSRVSSQAFRENMMLEFEWSEESSNVTVMALNEAHRQTARPRQIVWLGSWADWQRPLLWGLGASEMQITGYPYEALVLSKRLRDIQHDLADTLRETTARVTGQSTSAMRPFTLKWDQTNIQETCQTIRRYWNKQARGGAEASDAWDEASDNLYSEENIEEAMLYAATADEIAQQSSRSPAEEDGEDEMIAAVQVSFTDGGAVLARADHEFMVLPKDKSDAEQRIASQLQPGDRVLIFSAAQHADVFDLVLSRTQHLLDIDRRAVDFWKQALRRIRLQYPSDEWGRGVEFCEALGQLGCERDRVTMRTWLTGTTMAPRAEHDIACVLQVSGIGSDAAHWAQIIAREMNNVRSFHRRIGRRIMQRIQSQGDTPSADLIDAEIDELLEETELRIIDHVSDLFDSPKGRIGITLEEDSE